MKMMKHLWGSEWMTNRVRELGPIPLSMSRKRKIEQETDRTAIQTEQGKEKREISPHACSHCFSITLMYRIWLRHFDGRRKSQSICSTITCLVFWFSRIFFDLVHCSYCYPTNLSFTQFELAQNMRQT